MALNIDGIEVNANTVVNAIKYYYPKTFEFAEKNQAYNYLFLFGIRVSACDTSLPDDIIGAIRYAKSATGGGYYEGLISAATTDPSPYYQIPPVNKVNGKCPNATVKSPSGKVKSVRTEPCTGNRYPNKCCSYFDSEARTKGGTAWVAVGQHIYKLYRNGQLFKGFPAFSPVDEVEVYRWYPSYVGDVFSESKALKSTSTSCYIHRSWWSDKLFNDSAGCQVITDNNLLRKMKDWALAHNKNSNYPKFYTYTLLSKEQFVNANRAIPAPALNLFEGVRFWWQQGFKF